MNQVCTSCASSGRAHDALNGFEDSFSLHLRAECSDYREIMSSQVVLNAAVDREQRLKRASLEPGEVQHQRAYSISHGQVLGGFASLGLQTETGTCVEPQAPSRQPPLRSTSKGSTDSSEPPATPIEWRDSFGTLAATTSVPPPKWAYLTGRPCNPLEPLDVLSIEEMGFHSLDIGSLNDWEGCKLSAEILCPLKGHQRIEWSIAQTRRRNKKWVVVPNATATCGATEPLSVAAQAERTVVVSERSLWLDESAAGVTQQRPAPSTSTVAPLQMQPSFGAAVAPSQRSFRPFSGKAGFELRLLRPTSGKICPPVYLANPSTHRYLHQYRKEIASPTLRFNGSIGSDSSDRQSTKASQPVYPVLRRSRSRPYLRPETVPLRRSHSKPHIHYSAHQQAAEPASPRTNPEEFAPSLPGDPLVRMLPDESWPSARSHPIDSLSSLDTASSSDAGSDTSSDDAGRSATNTHGSVTGSMSSDSYDQRAHRNSAAETNHGECARSAAIPMRIGGAQTGRACRSLSPSSSASRDISTPSEPFAVLPGWQHGSLEQQRFQQPLVVSASYEVDSWPGTSPTTISASSLSASSKQSRSRKGFQKALQKKDKMLSSWFKRRPENSAPFSVSNADDRGAVQPALPNSAPRPGHINTASSSSRSSLARDSHEISGLGAITGSVPLTETALESFQRAIFRPASPESTIMGSRRGSEALTQKTIEPPIAIGERAAAAPTSNEVQGKSGAAPSPVYPPQERLDGTENRSAVNSTLSKVYGWEEEEAAGKLLCPVAGVRSGPADYPSQDSDEDNALLGLDAVPAGALTMLIPLPLIGRSRAQDAVRYMRVNFVPFGNVADPVEAPQSTSSPPAALLNVSTPSNEIEPGLSQSTSTGSGNFATTRDAGSAAKSSEQSSWKRKLGLASGLSRTGGNDASATASQNGSNSQQVGGLEMPQSSPPSSKPEAFRITAIVHDAPRTLSSSSQLDPRLPEPGTFPVVLGYCNGTKALDMVPEGWGALRLAGVPIPTKPDGSPLDGIHPLRGVTDLIIAACTAVMDV